MKWYVVILVALLAASIVFGQLGWVAPSIAAFVVFTLLIIYSAVEGLIYLLQKY